MEKSILISFIGTGKPAKGSGKDEYEETEYKFPDKKKYSTTLITSAIFNYLTKVGEKNLEKVIVVGTQQSIWSELSKIRKIRYL